MTRLLVLLRGHGLITKVAKTHRYQLTEKRPLDGGFASKVAVGDRLSSLSFPNS